MDWELAERRRAITAWRDYESIAISRIFFSTAADTLTGFDTAIGEAGWREALLYRESFARTHIDRQMRRSIEAALGQALRDAARRLRLIDPKLEARSVSPEHTGHDFTKLSACRK